MIINKCTEAIKNVKDITLPNGLVTNTWSREYMVYCEAKTIARWSLPKRRSFLDEMKNTAHVNKLKKWLKFFWENKK